MQRLSRWFSQGVLVLLPLLVTIVVVRWVVAVLGQLAAFLPLAPWARVIVALAFIALVGWAAGFYSTRWLLAYGDRILGSIPLVRTIYNSVKQMADALADPGRFLGRPVLVPVGGQTRVLGFFVEEVRVPGDDRPWACVFVPMSLNLTGGFNLFVPLEEVVDVPDVDREEAFRFVLTAGASMPAGLLWRTRAE